MDFLYELGLFVSQTLFIVLAILITAGGILSLRQRRQMADKGYIEATLLNDRYKDFADTVAEVGITDEELKQKRKAEKKEDKKNRKQKKTLPQKLGLSSGVAGDTATRKARLFVLHFDGDLHASQAEQLREEISAVLADATSDDEVLLCLESGGGVVHGYGLAASQLQRIRNANVNLTIAIDKVAASGGYMMAVVGTKIIAAPFAILGSIGVLAQIPNFHRLLKKHDIDVELLTAGEYKRTLTMFGENTDKAREKFLLELEETHTLFKRHVAKHRTALDLDAVATGEVWYGEEAQTLGLVDDIATSDEYIQAKLTSHDVIEVRYEVKQSWQTRFGHAITAGTERALSKLLQKEVLGRWY
jgi:serine protease SohB